MTETNIVLAAFNKTPPITKAISIILVTLSLLIYTKIISPFHVVLNPRLYTHLHFWQVITPFYYFGTITFDSVLHMIFLYRYSRMLEDSFIQTSDYFYLLLTVKILLLVSALLFKIHTLGPALSATITYIWTRRNPTTQVQLLGCVIFPAFYLPFIVPIFTFLTDRKINMEDLLGIFVGHFYYFFKFVFPKFGFNVLKTPFFIQKIFNEQPFEEIKKGDLVGDNKEEEEGVNHKEEECVSHKEDEEGVNHKEEEEGVSHKDGLSNEEGVSNEEGFNKEDTFSNEEGVNNSNSNSGASTEDNSTDKR
ncbi:Der1-like protein [Hamiltosporidium magnivora]|uniref:Derlin n=1 Tax=Hamiltosporidium magnivora TaxID=148818 RepID=A0A4Q9KYV2_9MICR|nr:Der1-like protein [Hamiltosporidium magnivora]